MTHHRFRLESPNLHQTCILGYSRLVLKMEVIDIDLQDHFCHFDWEFQEIWLVRAMTHHRFWARIIKFTPNMQSGIRSAVTEGGGHWPWPSRSFWPFWLKILGRLACPSITCSGCDRESPNLYQTCNLIYSQLLLKMGLMDLDLQGYLAISSQETAFNVALVYWFRPAKECYMSQTCSCYPYLWTYSSKYCSFLFSYHYLFFLLSSGWVVIALCNYFSPGN